MPDDVVRLWILVAVVDTVLALFVLFYWHMARRGNPSFRLSFRTTDLWAATIGLAPAFLYFAKLLNGSSEDRLLAPLALALLGPHQLCGMFIALIRTERGSSVVNSSAVGSFFLVLGGALLGLVLFPFSIALALAVPIAIILLILISPFLLLMMIFLYVYKKTSAPSAPNRVTPPADDI